MKKINYETEEKKKIRDGVYLVADPSMKEDLLLEKLNSALQGPVSALQIWDHFSQDQDVFDISEKISVLAEKKNVPVLINNRVDILQNTMLSGIHFDVIPKSFDGIRDQIGRPFISGLTCNNDLASVRWAARHGMDYISFCSVFPSVTSNSCELVDFEIIREARRIFSGSIFLSGGINTNNIEKLDSLDYDGVAIVSGIMSADQPGAAVENYLNKMKFR